MLNTLRLRRSLLLLPLVALLLLPACGGSNGPENGTIRFVSTSCICVSGTIRAFVDNVQVGTLGCNSSFSVTVPAGTHTVSAQDNTGSWGPATVSVNGGATTTYNLNC